MVRRICCVVPGTADLLTISVDILVPTENPPFHFRPTTMNTARQFAATFPGMLLSICATALAMNASLAEASPNGLNAATEIPPAFQTNAADASGGADRLVVGSFTGESVSRDVVKMGVKTEGLAPNPASGASLGSVLTVCAGIVFGFAWLLSSNQGSRRQYAAEKAKAEFGKRRKRHVPF